MLASADTERLRLFAMIGAEVRITRPEDDSVVQECVFAYLSEKVPGIPHNIFDVETYDHEFGLAFNRIASDQLSSDLEFPLQRTGLQYTGSILVA